MPRCRRWCEEPRSRLGIVRRCWCGGGRGCRSPSAQPGSAVRAAPAMICQWTSRALASWFRLSDWAGPDAGGSHCCCRGRPRTGSSTRTGITSPRRHATCRVANTRTRCVVFNGRGSCPYREGPYVGWTCWRTAEHVSGDFAHYAAQVASRATDHYVTFSFDTTRAKTPAELREVVRAAGGFLSACVRVADPIALAWHPHGMYTGRVRGDRRGRRNCARHRYRHRARAAVNALRRGRHAGRGHGLSRRTPARRAAVASPAARHRPRPGPCAGPLDLLRGRRPHLTAATQRSSRRTASRHERTSGRGLGT